MLIGINTETRGGNLYCQDGPIRTKEDPGAGPFVQDSFVGSHGIKDSLRDNSESQSNGLFIHEKK